jgi:hypothetical protein
MPEQTVQDGEMLSISKTPAQDLNLHRIAGSASVSVADEGTHTPEETVTSTIEIAEIRGIDGAEEDVEVAETEADTERQAVEDQVTAETSQEDLEPEQSVFPIVASSQLRESALHSAQLVNTRELMIIKVNGKPASLKTPHRRRNVPERNPNLLMMMNQVIPIFTSYPLD